jgi:cellulose synthase/poly-beta-1,6-N-acetylglucosamine synthase-like glycosyltransferase/peptidoglycan/xylan/chitin deacetylase (PgdA/CDA1 family)
VVLAGLLLLLFTQGLTTKLTGASRTPTAPANAAAAIEVPRGRAVLTASADGTRLVSRQPDPGHRIALTFDDGPDPRWTPRIAAVLERLKAPATFFVVGERVAAEPGIVRRLHREGFEIGNHTFSHSALTGIAGWQLSLQLSLTESAVAGAAGIRPRLVRPPYSSSPEAVSKADRSAFLHVAREGYLITLSNFDGEDWRRPGIRKIVEFASPPGEKGGIVLMHDGGGDRSQTVAAVAQLIPKLRRRGFEIVPLRSLLGIPASSAELHASSNQQLRGELLIGALSAARWITALLGFLLVPIAILAVLRAGVLAAFARRHARAFRRRPPKEDFLPPVSILVPAYNEAEVIEAAVRSLAASDYPDFEVIVIDDGSDDGTGDIVEAMGLPGVRLLREANKGKPGALNTGIAAAAHDVLVCVDADTVFEPVTLRRLVQPFEDAAVGAVAGNTKVGNRGGMLGRWQHIDYVMGFNLDRRLFDILRCMPTVPGAVGGFRRQALDEVGRFSGATLAEDTDLTIALGRAGWRIAYAEDARAFTEAPSTLAALWRQRYRWSYGTMQAVWKHRRALIEKAPIGRRGLPYLLLFQIALPMLAPLIDVFTLYGLFFLDPLPVLAYWVGFNVLLLSLGAFSFSLDGEPLRPLWAMPLQQFVYRQLMYLVVIQSIISAVRGTRLRWQHMERSGDELAVGEIAR